MVARSYTRRGDSSEYLVAVLVYCANPYPRVAPIFEMLWANVVSEVAIGCKGPVRSSRQGRNKDPSFDRIDAISRAMGVSL